MTKLTKSYTEETETRWCHYDGVNYITLLTLDLQTGEAEIDTHVSGAVPFDAYHGLVLQWVLPEALLVSAGNTLLDEVSEWLQAILDDSSIEWDGHNHVGKLGEDAREASEELENWIEESWMSSQVCADVVSCEDWLDESIQSIREEVRRDGTPVAQLAEEYVEYARNQGVLLVGDVEGTIEDILEEGE